MDVYRVGLLRPEDLSKDGEWLVANSVVPRDYSSRVTKIGLFMAGVPVRTDLLDPC